MTIGERIKTIREEIGLSQVECADKIGISKQSLYKYENNIITNIPTDKIEALAKLFHVSPCYLMGWDKTKEPEPSNYDITDHEYELILAYRKAPDYQKMSICDMLHVKGDDAESSSSRKQA